MNELKPLLVELSSQERFQRLLAGVPDTAGMKSGQMILKPGESVGAHRTQGKEESIIVLEGEAQVFCEGRMLFVAPKDSLVYIPPETEHDIKNSAAGLLRYVYVVASVR
jgi:mannose-6-phosphate isomerase-like protein (cupin superfamily)